MSKPIATVAFPKGKEYVTFDRYEKEVVITFGSEKLSLPIETFKRVEFLWDDSNFLNKNGKRVTYE